MSNTIQKICLVCMDRTGSNMVSQRLNSHPDIVFYNELFHRQYIIFYDGRMAGAKEKLATRDRNPRGFVNRIWAGKFEPEEEREKIKSIGFKLFLNHNAEALQHVIQSDAKIIFLRRRNPISRYSSFKIAVATGEWHAEKRSEKNTKIDFRLPEFRAYTQNYLSLEKMFRMVTTRWNRPFFDLWYEDLVSDPEVWDRMCEYIGYAGNEFGESSLVKQNSKDLLSRFSNPEVVQEYVTSINKEEWLTE